MVNQCLGRIQSLEKRASIPRKTRREHDHFVVGAYAAKELVAVGALGSVDLLHCDLAWVVRDVDRQDYISVCDVLELGVNQRFI